MAKEGKKKDFQRDEKGRFIPGYAGGPGRGKKKGKPDLTEMNNEDFWQAIENLLRQDMTSDDAMIRQRALKLKIAKDQYLEKIAESNRTHLISPAILAALGQAFDRMLPDNKDIIEDDDD